VDIKTRKKLSSLHTLDLSTNQFTSLPPVVWHLTSLQVLSLVYNQISSLPAELEYLTSLQKLNLGNNQFTSVPPVVWKITSLKELLLFCNKATVLPPDVGKLTALERLQVEKNQLTKLPPELGHLTSLRRLDLTDNQLTSLPAEIGQLSALKTLWVNRNQLTSLPAEIGKLSALKTLVLDRNQLASLPPELGQLSALETLVLEGNPLYTPSPDIIEQGTAAILAYLRALPQQRALSSLLQDPQPNESDEKEQQQTRIELAEQLLQGGRNRAAGAIAGVLLESHLKKLCDRHHVPYPDKKGLQVIIQALRQKDAIAAGEASHLTHLASIRNKCAHAGPVSEQEVRLLVEEVKKFGDWVNRAKNGDHLPQTLIGQEAAKTVQPNRADLLERAQKLLDQNRYEEALRAYDRAIQLDPNDASAYRNKGVALAGLGRYEEIFDELDRYQESANVYPTSRTDESTSQVTDQQTLSAFQNVPATNEESRKTIASSPRSLTARPEAIKAFHTLQVYSGSSCHVALSADGLTLASGAHDRTIKLWKVR
jgi:tetratricopeptide (TPR) repeat protein